MLGHIVLIILGYLFGSLSWGLIIGKVFYHKDIRQYGSGNTGGTNAGRILGKPAGVAVIVLDAIKAIISMLIAYLVYGNETTLLTLVGVACCIGHCYPVFSGFKGGKAVATTYGYALGLVIFVTHNPLYIFFIPIIIFFVCLYFSKMVSLSSMLSLMFLPIMSFIMHYDSIITISVLLIWIFVVYRHRENIQRIINHQEKKITWM